MYACCSPVTTCGVVDARTLNRDEVMNIWRLGNCKNCAGKREELVMDAFSDSEPVERV